jgi:hypothetical protein
VALPGGGFAVAYSDGFFDPNQVSVKTFTNTGDVSQTFFPASNATNSTFDPSISVLDNGFLSVTWAEVFSNTDTDIHARILDPKTGTFVTDPLTIEFDGGVQETPAVAGLDAGRFVTVWTDQVSSEDGSDSSIRAQIDELTRTLTSDGAGDTLTGDALRDLMFGNGGNDVLKAQAGKDLFDGGRGADDLVAGVDNVQDTFLYDAKADSGRTATTWDQLFQFDRSLSRTDKTSDKIDLRLLDADPAAGDQAFRFVTSFTTPTATQSDGQARVVDAGRHVNVEIDSNGDNAADMILQVMNIDTLTGRDFLL